MEFEHLIQINDPLNPLVTPLTREALWFGLICRAENPKPFLPGLEDFKIDARGSHELKRTLNFGTIEIQDTVDWEAFSHIRFTVSPSAGQPGGTLTIRIEEPAPTDFFLRFHYSLPIRAEDAEFTEYLKSAYVESDIDTVRVIRMLAESQIEH